MLGTHTPLIGAIDTIFYGGTLLGRNLDAPERRTARERAQVDGLRIRQRRHITVRQLEARPSTIEHEHDLARRNALVARGFAVFDAARPMLLVARVAHVLVLLAALAVKGFARRCRERLSAEQLRVVIVDSGAGRCAHRLGGRFGRHRRQRPGLRQATQSSATQGTARRLWLPADGLGFPPGPLPALISRSLAIAPLILLGRLHLFPADLGRNAACGKCIILGRLLGLSIGLDHRDEPGRSLCRLDRRLALGRAVTPFLSHRHAQRTHDHY